METNPWLTSTGTNISALIRYMYDDQLKVRYEGLVKSYELLYAFIGY